jgi:hypothetical protein
VASVGTGGGKGDGEGVSVGAGKGVALGSSVGMGVGEGAILVGAAPGVGAEALSGAPQAASSARALISKPWRMIDIGSISTSCIVSCSLQHDSDWPRNVPDSLFASTNVKKIDGMLLANATAHK